MKLFDRDAVKERWIAVGKALAYLALFLLSQSIVSVVFVIAVALRQMMEGRYIDSYLLTQQVMEYTDWISLVSGLITLGVLVVYFRLQKRTAAKEVRLSRVPRELCLFSAAMAAPLYLLVTLVLSLLPEQWLEAYGLASEGLQGMGLIPLLARAIMAPLVEEIIFRGLIQSRLEYRFPWVLSLVGSSLLFGLCHGQAVWMGYTFVLGLVFGYINRVGGGSILPSLTAHAVFNAVGCLLIVLEEHEISGMVILFLLAGLSIAACVRLVTSGKVSLRLPVPTPVQEPLPCPVEDSLPAADPTQEPEEDVPASEQPERSDQSEE